MSSTPNPPQVPDPTAQGAETPAVPEDAAPVASGPAEGALPAQGSDGDWEKKFNRLERRAKRDRTARAEAEKLLEDKAAELYAAKQNLEKLLQERDQEVEKRTRQLKTARDDLAQALSERTQYFSSISHEIRTPLNMVPELIGQISEATTDRMTLDHCTIIERAIQDVLDTLTGFILLSDNNQLGERDPETLFDLPDLVDHACSIDRHRAEQKGIAFQIDLPQDFERAFWGHPHLLQTALRQLTANAADHTKTGHIKVSVSGAVTEERPSMIHFQVQDSGSGLDPKMARDRLSGNTTLRPGIGGTGAGGIGVGLPLVA
ncbi:MAG: sensor histidine kinase, partial [Rhodospirillaceae bacterium]